MTAEAKLAKLGIRSRFDLVLHLPSCMAAVLVSALVIEAIQHTVSALIGVSCPSTRLPKAPS